MLDELLEQFTMVLEKYESSNLKIQKLFHILASFYSEEDRYYHNLYHIQSMLLGLQENKDLVNDYLPVYLAIWFHDAIYDSHSENNEEKSAEFAAYELQRLNIPDSTIKFCCELILSTKFHIPVYDIVDCYLFLDLDLCILGKDSNTYQQYARNVRKEYAWVPEDTFAKGRYNVLSQFLARERIYFTERFFQKYETQARKNISQEMEEIQKSSLLVLPIS